MSGNEPASAEPQKEEEHQADDSHLKTDTGSPEAQAGGPTDGLEESGEQEEDKEPELVAPDVNEAVLSQMVDMGFPRNRAVRALYFGGEGENLDAAIAWLDDHEYEEDIDEPLLVKKVAKQELSKEEIRQQAEELRKRAKARREVEDKELAAHQEKERIRVGKELMMAKRTEEEMARKKLIEERKKEKEDDKRARNAIRMKLEEDKKERRRKLGLPEELTEEEKVALEEKRKKKEAEKSEKDTPKFVKPIGALAGARTALVNMKRNNDETAFKTASNTLLKYLGNIARDANEEKYRRIRLGNKAFQERVASVSYGLEFLEHCGFTKDESGEYLVMAVEAVNMELINGAGALLDSALTNPFFGVL